MYVYRSPCKGYVHLTSSRYNFKSDPRSVGAVVILSADESSYTGSSQFMMLDMLLLTDAVQTPDPGILTRAHLIRLVRRTLLHCGKY